MPVIGLDVAADCRLYGGGAALDCISSSYSLHTGIGACVLSGRPILLASKIAVYSFEDLYLLSKYIKTFTEAPVIGPDTRMHGPQ